MTAGASSFGVKVSSVPLLHYSYPAKHKPLTNAILSRTTANMVLCFSIEPRAPSSHRVCATPRCSGLSPLPSLPTRDPLSRPVSPAHPHRYVYELTRHHIAIAFMMVLFWGRCRRRDVAPLCCKCVLHFCGGSVLHVRMSLRVLCRYVLHDLSHSKQTRPRISATLRRTLTPLPYTHITTSPSSCAIRLLAKAISRTCPTWTCLAMTTTSHRLAWERGVLVLDGGFVRSICICFFSKRIPVKTMILCVRTTENLTSLVDVSHPISKRPTHHITHTHTHTHSGVLRRPHHLQAWVRGRGRLQGVDMGACRL